MEHDFYKTGDGDAFVQIKDRNGEVVLSCCRRCGQAEGDLSPECPGGNVDKMLNASDTFWLNELAPPERIYFEGRLKELKIPDNWLPTLENVNRLPKPVFDYIHGLESLCDPAGIIRENSILRDDIGRLGVMLDESLGRTSEKGVNNDPSV